MQKMSYLLEKGIIFFFFFFIMLVFYSFSCAQFCCYRLVSSIFLFCLTRATSSFWKTSLNDLFINKLFRCLQAPLLIFRRNILFVKTSGIAVYFEIVMFFSFTSVFLSTFSFAFIFYFINYGL